MFFRTSSESEYVPSDSDLSNAKSKEKSLDTSSEKLDSPNEKKRVTFDDNSNAKVKSVLYNIDKLE